MGYTVSRTPTWEDRERVMLRKMVPFSKKAGSRVDLFNNYNVAFGQDPTQTLVNNSASGWFKGAAPEQNWSLLDGANTAPGAGSPHNTIEFIPDTAGGGCRTIPLASTGGQPYYYLHNTGRVDERFGTGWSGETPGLIAAGCTTFAASARFRISSLGGLNSAATANNFSYFMLYTWNSGSGAPHTIYAGYGYDSGTTKHRWRWADNGVGVWGDNVDASNVSGVQGWHTSRVAVSGTTLYGQLDNGPILSVGGYTPIQYPLYPAWLISGSATVINSFDMLACMTMWDGP